MHSKTANCWTGGNGIVDKKNQQKLWVSHREQRHWRHQELVSPSRFLFWKSLWHHPQPQSHHSRKESSPGGCHQDHQHHFTSSLSGRQRATETLEGKRQVDVMQLPLAYSTYSPKISWGTLLYLYLYFTYGFGSRPTQDFGRRGQQY